MISLLLTCYSFLWRFSEMEEKFCTNCGTLDYPQKKNKGSVGVEAVLLLVSVFGAAVNLLLAAALFIVFVVYCVWRLSTKHLACSSCASAQVISPDSPMARNLISQIYKANN